MSAPSLTQYRQGIGEVDADGLNTFMQSCNTIAQLRAFVGTVGQTIGVLGTAAIGDGGGGVYYWSASSTAADNGSTVVRPTGTAVGAWLWLGYFPTSFGLTPLTPLTDFGGSDAAAFDNTTALTNAKASGKPIFIPYGTGDDYLSTLTQPAGFPGRMWGDGVVQDGSGNSLARFFSYLTSAPSALGSENSILTAFNGDWTRSPFPVEHYITGAATLGQPTSGYLYTPEAYPHYTYLFNTSGYNNSTSSNIGRTAAVAYRTRVYQAGQGDAVAFNASAFVSSTLAGSTSFLANPAIVLFNGDMQAGVAGAYLNAGEMNLQDVGFDVAGIGWVVNLNRTVNTGAKSAWWSGIRLQSTGSAAVDTFWSVSGPARFGLDLSFGDFSSNSQAAITLKVDQRIYGNVAASDPSGLSRFPTLTNDYLGYSSSISGWLFVVGNVPSLQVTNSQVTSTVAVKMTANVGFFGTTPGGKPTITGAKAGNAALTSLLAGLSGLGLVNDTTT